MTLMTVFGISSYVICTTKRQNFTVIQNTSLITMYYYAKKLVGCVLLKLKKNVYDK